MHFSCIRVLFAATIAFMLACSVSNLLQPRIIQIFEYGRQASDPIQRTGALNRWPWMVFSSVRSESLSC